MSEKLQRTRAEELEETRQRMERFNEGASFGGNRVPHIDYFQLTPDTPGEGVFLEGDVLYRITGKRTGKRISDGIEVVEFRLSPIFNTALPLVRLQAKELVGEVKTFRQRYSRDGSWGYGPDEDSPKYSFDGDWSK